MTTLRAACEGMTDDHTPRTEETPSASELLTFGLAHGADAQARAVIGAELDRFNEQQTGGWDNDPLDVIIRDDAGRVVGGVVGRTSLGVLFVDYLVVPEALRGRGAGSRALAMPRRRRCGAVV